MPLSQLTAALLPLFTGPGSEAVTEAVLRSKVVDFATRKSYAPKDGERAAPALQLALSGRA